MGRINADFLNEELLLREFELLQGVLEFLLRDNLLVSVIHSLQSGYLLHILWLQRHGKEDEENLLPPVGFFDPLKEPIFGEMHLLPLFTVLGTLLRIELFLRQQEEVLRGALNQVVDYLLIYVLFIVVISSSALFNPFLVALFLFIDQVLNMVQNVLFGVSGEEVVEGYREVLSLELLDEGRH